MQFCSNVPQNSFCIMEGRGIFRNNSDGEKSLKSYLTNLTTSPMTVWGKSIDMQKWRRRSVWFIHTPINHSKIQR